MNKILPLFVVVSGLLVSLNTVAEARRDGGADDPMRRAQLMIRQLSQQKSALEAETAKLNADIESLTGQVDTLEKKVDKTESELGQYKERTGELVTRIKSDVEKYKDLLEKYRHTATTLRVANNDNAHLIEAVKERNHWIDRCQVRNEEMFQANMDLLNRYQGKSAWDAIKQNEPVTGIAKVELENQLQEYQFKLEDLQMIEFQETGNYQAYNRAVKPDNTQ